MKLISRRLRMNKETHAPEMVVELAMPMEFAMDALCRTEEEFETKLGKELIALLREKE